MLFGPRSISSLRGELVPYLVRKQFMKILNVQTDDKQTEQSQKRKDANSSLGKLLSLMKLRTVHRGHNKGLHSIHSRAKQVCAPL